MIAATCTLAERPDLVEAMWSLPNTWPEFMQQDPIANLLFGRLPTVFPEFQLVALDADGALIGKVHAVPFAWEGTDDDLPDRGWDAVLQRAFLGEQRAVTPTAVSLIEARVTPGLRGSGLSAQLLEAQKRNVRSLGFTDLFGPVRPTMKSQEPHTPMGEYAFRVRADGLPYDPWLRVHARLGARTVKVCPASMVVPGSLAMWRAWTGLPFDVSGPTVVPDALNPVQVSVEHDHAVYIEPNVWMHHRVDDAF